MLRFLSILLLLILPVGAMCAPRDRSLTPSEMTNLKQAIQDEIYDYGYYQDFYGIGENIGTPDHWVSRLHLFVNPLYNSAENYGEVIYKIMPYGQIYRVFSINSRGRIVLIGDPQNRFPATQPSHQTVFMDSLDVCKDQESWDKTTFVVDTKPTTTMIKDAAQRQKVRTGFSDWEYEHPREK